MKGDCSLSCTCGSGSCGWSSCAGQRWSPGCQRWCHRLDASFPRCRSLRCHHLDASFPRRRSFKMINIWNTRSLCTKHPYLTRHEFLTPAVKISVSRRTGNQKGNTLRQIYTGHQVLAESVLAVATEVSYVHYLLEQWTRPATVSQFLEDKTI